MTRLNIQPPPQRILLVLPTWVGDVVMATPFIKALHDRYADADISLLMHQHLADILDGSPWLAHTFYWPRKGTDKRQYKHEYKLFLNELRNARFDLAVLLPNSLRVAWLAWRIGATRRVGFNRDGRGMLLTDRLEVPNKISGGFAPIPLVEYYQHLALYLDCAPSGDALQLFTTPADEQSTRACLARHDINDPSQVVVICPGANFGASKCWPAERFAAAADHLVREQQMHIVISPGPGEEPLAAAIAAAMQEPSVLLQQPCLTLGELKCLIKDSALLLGNDTGPRHFARAFATPRVTVFGPTEAQWTHTSHDRETIVRVNVPCGPCHKKVCPLDEQVCMDQVTVVMVNDACAEQLAYKK